jgi:hypothetical protein
LWWFGSPHVSQTHDHAYRRRPAPPAVVRSRRDQERLTPLAPKAGKSVPAGKRPTFKVRAKGPGQVWVHVCKSTKKDKDGLICPDEAIGRAKKQGGTFKFKAPFFDFAEFWLNSPGTYYWQAHRISCDGDLSDCRKEGPIVKFRVAG